jgi:hypothetical protein
VLDLAVVREGIANKLDEHAKELSDMDDLKYPLEAENIRALYQHPALGIGRKAQLSLMTVEYAIGGFDEWQIEFCKLNRGWMEFAVASVLLWLNVIDVRIREFLIDTGVFSVPIKFWIECFSGWLNDVRKYNGVGFEDEELDVLAASQIRKMNNLTGRDLLPADAEKEARSMLADQSVKMYPGIGKKLEYDTWFQHLQIAIKELIDEIRNPIMEGANLRTMKEWWQTRRAWVPSGSSSMKGRLKELKQSDHRIKSSDRPNKAQVVESISYLELLEHLWSEPFAEARASTKPEPGFKRRALYASDDMSTYIASYASADIEKVASVGGMVAKQTPVDTVDWLKADRLRSNFPNRIWLSLDYADFNKEHSKLSLYYLNKHLSNMWRELANSELSTDIMMSKAHCAWWVALSHLNSYSYDLDGAYNKHVSGLWSGHRDTARDNTMLHWCYSNMMKKAVFQTMGLETGVHYMGICGDDEDGLHDDWVSMVAYLGMHKVCGMNLNPVKQLTDWYAHEFLQRQANRDELPYRPIAPMIATLSTGSWYKPSRVYYDSVIPSLSENCKEIIARGADPKIMLKVIMNMINRMMVVNLSQDEGVEAEPLKIELEWWEYRHGGEGLDTSESLWHGTGNGMPMPKLEESNFMVDKIAPKQALEDWMESKNRWFEHVSEVGQRWYKDQLCINTYKNYYGNYRERMRNDLAVESFGSRQNFVDREMIERLIQEGTLIYGKPIPQLEPKSILREIDMYEVERRPLTHEVLLDRLHIDNGILELIGGWKGFFKVATPEDMSKWEKVPDVQMVPVPTELAYVDPAIKNWWKLKNAVIRYE